MATLVSLLACTQMNYIMCMLSSLLCYINKKVAKPTGKVLLKSDKLIYGKTIHTEGLCKWGNKKKGQQVQLELKTSATFDFTKHVNEEWAVKGGR